MGFFRRLLNLLRPRARTSVTDHDHWDKHRERRGHRYRHTHANRDSELFRYPSQDRTSVTSHGRPSMTYEPPSMTYEPPSMTHEQPPMTSDERYRTPYNEQPPTSTRRHHDAQFFTALPSAPFSPVALPGTSGNLPTIGRLDPPGALGILMHDEQQHNQEERPNLYRTIPLPSVTSTPGNSPVSNNQAVSASMVPPQANHLGPEESSPDAGNSTSLLFESPVQGITYEIPQYLHLVKNLKIESPISIRRFLSILTCSHLEMFSVTTNEDDVTHAVDFSGRVPAGNLISLSIVTSVESKLLLDRFMARNLRIFHLEWNSQGSRIPIPNSADIGIDLFVKQSGCRLNMLSLHVCDDPSLALLPAHTQCLALALPPELLGQIFLSCLEPKEITRVCQYWRNVAISLPILWSTLSPDFKSTPGKIALYRLWLERSQNHPLTFNFLDTLPKSDPALDLYFSHMHHWGDVQADMGSESIYRLLTLRTEMVPLLEKLEIWNHTKSTEDEQRIDNLTPVLASFSSLSEIIWSGYIPRNISSIAWPYLRRFVICESFDTRQCLLLMARCPMIEEIVILDLMNSTHDITLPIVDLPHLRTLYLKGDTGQLLDQLVLPSLHSLDMTPPMDDNALERLGARSSCNLFHLRLFEDESPMHTISEWNALEYLRSACCQTLRSLHIEPATTDTFLRNLTWKVDGEIGNQYLPDLVELSARSYTTDGIVSEMVASRWNIQGKGNPPARLVCLDICQMVYARVEGDLVTLPLHSYYRDRAVLGELADQGLILTDGYGSSSR
ncbi:hypothetical protein E4T56_gene2332 [Termitomyces sp. T112]|nr:hypothetical protein E4T56_gene2332 [Termitomyces sp. T112]